MDDARFEAAWSAYAPSVLRYSTYSTGSSEAGEDVTAETFSRFLARGERVADVNVEAWLIRVARNLCASYHRDNKRRRQLEERVAAGLPREDSWQRPDSWEYVRRLKEAERLVVYLRVAEGRPFAEIGRITAKSEAAVKMTFYRAIERLRRNMQCDAAHSTTLEGGADYA